MAPKPVRHIGALLFTVLSDAHRLGVLQIVHPMANRRVLLPKLTKRRPAVLDEGKLQTLGRGVAVCIDAKRPNSMNGTGSMSVRKRMAGTTGLEPATSDVTGRRSNQLNYVPFEV